MKKVNRRDFLKTSAFTGMALTIGGLRPMTSWGAEPFKIMVGTTFSGAYAETGEFVRKGVNLAVKEYGGTVLGRPVEVIERDVPNPNEGVRKAQEAVEKLGCKYLFTSPSSSTALAVMEYAAQKKVFVLPCAGSDAVTGKSCNKYAFRWPIPTWGAAREVVPRVIIIAEAHAIEDPMDLRVVDAYWIGNTLSDRVDPVLMTQSMDVRFKAQLLPEAWKWLQGKPEAGARPTHAFHVFDVFPRVGLMRGGAMDSCRIRWGRVLEVSGESLVVNAVPLELVQGKLTLAEARPQTVRRWLDGTGFISDVAAGDIVSLHWDWACEVLSPARLEALQRRTVHQLGLANQTI